MIDVIKGIVIACLLTFQFGFLIRKVHKMWKVFVIVCCLIVVTAVPVKETNESEIKGAERFNLL